MNVDAFEGPRLRDECRQFMESRNFEDFPIGEVLNTKAYALPSEQIFHVVGPMARYKGQEQPDLLSKCYISCLEEMCHRGLKSIAFCCISTGVFGYPQEPAAILALETVKSFVLEKGLESSYCIEQIVFNVFTERDLDIYNHFCPKIFEASSFDTEHGSIIIDCEL